MLILSKEASEKDRSSKTQLLVSANPQSEKKIIEEVICQKSDFFQDERADFNIKKKKNSQECLDLHKSGISLNCYKW